MKKIDYQIIIHARNGGKRTEHFDNEDDRANRVVDLSKGANVGNETERIQLVEERLDEKSFVKDVALIASVITAEFCRPLMIKTLLSKEETHTLIASVAVSCYSNLTKGGKYLNTQIIPEAQNCFLQIHNIKL